MNCDIQNWTKACLCYQAAKVTKHITTTPTIMAPSCVKFHDIHLNINGPLNELKGMHYILTAVDRFSRWTMAEPIPDQLACMVADTFIKGWVQHHGIMHTITTDRGFESSLFNNLLKRLGSQHIHSTAYHPQHNGMIECWHSCLKDALRAAADKILLGRSAAPHHAQSARHTKWRWPADPCRNGLWQQPDPTSSLHHILFRTN